MAKNIYYVNYARNHTLGKPDKSERGEFPYWAFPLLGYTPHPDLPHSSSAQSRSNKGYAN